MCLNLSVKITFVKCVKMMPERGKAISCDDLNDYDSNCSYAEVAKAVYVKNQVNKTLVLFLQLSLI